MGEGRKLILYPIGRVCNPHAAEDASSWDGNSGWEEGTAEIEIDAAWAEALDGIGEFSHIWVVWWLDRFEEPPASPRVHPEGRQEMPEVGLFATRSPHRPCPIAITAVRLQEHDGTRLLVQGLDASPGTPVLDIKPYLRRGDLIPEATMPDWLERLWRIHDEEREAGRVGR
jgi:tRNA-Thr(GGU) m(6)t(6)A37 methyltransferase TsaA